MEGKEASAPPSEFVQQAPTQMGAPPPYPGPPVQGQPTGYPQTGYQQPGYPQGGYPQAGYPQAGYPQASYPQAGYPQAGYPQTGYPQAGYPQGGYPPQGYTGTPVVQQPGLMTNTTVVVNQPGHAVVRVAPPDHALLAWLTCLCCFWPVGIAAVVYSLQVNKLFNAGDYMGAQAASAKARSLAFIAIGLGVGLYVFITVLRVIVTAS